VKALGPQAPSNKPQAATFCRATKLIIELSHKQQATCDNLDSLKIYKKVYNYKIN